MAPDRGFTLLEVLIAFLIAALALAVLFEGGLSGLRAATVSDRTMEAVSRAQSHLQAAAVGDALTPGDRQGDEGHGYHWRVRIFPIATGLAQQTAHPGPVLTLYLIRAALSWSEDGTLPHRRTGHDARRPRRPRRLREHCASPPGRLHPAGASGGAGRARLRAGGDRRRRAVRPARGPTCRRARSPRRWTWKRPTGILRQLIAAMYPGNENDDPKLSASAGRLRFPNRSRQHRRRPGRPAARRMPPWAWIPATNWCCAGRPRCNCHPAWALRRPRALPSYCRACSGWKFAYWGHAPGGGAGAWLSGWAEKDLPPLVRIRLLFEPGLHRTWPDIIAATERHRPGS